MYTGSLFWVISVNIVNDNHAYCCMCTILDLVCHKLFLFLSFQTPLHYAAVSGQGDVCLELLLNDGAIPNLQVRND